MSARIQVRRGTAAQWTAANPVLFVGEPGLETDTGYQKVGDGATAWTSLPYQAAVLDVASGAAKLGSDGAVGGPGGSAISGVVDLNRSAIDLCRPPYNCTPGADITTTLQTAVNALVVAGSDTDFYFSQSGVYNINGAVQTPTVASAKSAGTCTISIASPAVITKAAHGLVPGDAVIFTTTGALPTGLTAGTVYFVLYPGNLSGSFQVSTMVGGAAVTTTGSQSGTHTVTPYYACAGQIVLPALATSASVRFRGTGTPMFAGGHVGVTLQSNATSGSVFAVMPTGSGSYPNYSFCMPRFENLTIVCPANPQCGALDLNTAFRAQVERVYIDGQTGDPTTLTGSGTAITLPRGTNGSFSILRDAYIAGFPYGICLGDHAQLHGDVYTSYCIVSLRGGNAAAANLNRVMALHCLNGIVPDGTLHVQGTFNWSET